SSRRCSSRSSCTGEDELERVLDLVPRLVQMGFIALVAPLVTGFIQKLKAYLQCRAGADVWQPYRDLFKLLRKGSVVADRSTVLFRAVPVLVLAATLTSATLVPVVWTPAATASAPLGDALLLLALLSLARFLTALGALDAGGAFGGMGASRDVTVGTLVEPV